MGSGRLSGWVFLLILSIFPSFARKKRRELGVPTLEEGAFAETKTQNHKHKKHRKELISRTERGCDNTEGSSFKEMPNSVNASVNCQR